MSEFDFSSTPQSTAGESAAAPELTPRDHILGILSAAAEPLGPSAVLKGLKARGVKKLDKLPERLAALCAEGTIHRWTAATAKTAKYWTHAPGAYLHDKLLELLSGEPLRLTQVMSTLKQFGGVPAVPKDILKAYLDELVTKGQLFRVGSDQYSTRDMGLVLEQAIRDALAIEPEKAHSATELRGLLQERHHLKPKGPDLASKLESLAATNQIHRAGKKFSLRAPPPPPPSIEQRLLDALRQQRAQGGQAYPVAMGRLAELAQVNLDSPLAKKAYSSKSSPFRAAVIAPVGKLDKDSLVALAEDVGTLARSPTVLEAALRAAESKSCLVTVEALAKKVTEPLRRAFEAAVGVDLANEALPDSVAWINDGGVAKLFLAKHLFPRRLVTGRDLGPQPATLGKPVAPRAAEPRAAEGFDAAFDAAFAHLDTNRTNSVSLVGLRRELSSFSREEFDRGLQNLRRDRRYGLSAAHEPRGISEEQRAAAIVEAGTVLLYVSKVVP